MTGPMPRTMLDRIHREIAYWREDDVREGAYRWDMEALIGEIHRLWAERDLLAMMARSSPADDVAALAIRLADRARPKETEVRS